LRKSLRERLRQGSGAENYCCVSSSFDVVGDIAILKMPVMSLEEEAIAEVIMNSNKGIKTVLSQISKISGPFRLRKIGFVVGEKKTYTVHKEHGCLFSVNLECCFFSPRLSGERLRIAQLVKPKETIVNMFAGVGCFSILIAKRIPSAKVYSIEINPDAYQLMKKNILLNRVYNKVIPLLGDSKDVAKTGLVRTVDRVIVPFPEKALEYLPYAVSLLKDDGGWIHCHVFEHDNKKRNYLDEANSKVTNTLKTMTIDFTIQKSRVVRSVGPNWFHIVADIHVSSLGKS
jgi:tRNA (guanine37-N1)-methyltransferase